MPRFRKKSVEVEAHQYGVDDSGWPDSWIPIPSDWRLREDERGTYLLIYDRLGPVRVHEGDWIIRDSEGFHACHRDSFEANYEPVEVVS